MEDLYLKFEKEKTFIKLQIEKEFEAKLNNEKDRFEQKLKIFKSANGLCNLEQLSENGVNGHRLTLDDTNNSIEYAKATVLVTQAYNKNKNLENEIESLKEIIKQKDDEIEKAKSETIQK